jgi:hypothetical protein
MREDARWLHEHYPRAPVYLWVLEANAPARHFYEKLGAQNAETSTQSPLAGLSAAAGTPGRRRTRYTLPATRKQPDS